MGTLFLLSSEVGSVHSAGRPIVCSSGADFLSVLSCSVLRFSALPAFFQTPTPAWMSALARYSVLLSSLLGVSVRVSPNCSARSAFFCSVL